MSTLTEEVIKEIKSEVEEEKYKKEKYRVQTLMVGLATRNQEINKAKKELNRFIKENNISDDLIEEAKSIGYSNIISLNNNTCTGSYYSSPLVYTWSCVTYSASTNSY